MYQDLCGFITGGFISVALTVPMQFEVPEPEVPVKTIAYAVVLFVIGTLLLVFGCLLFTGVIESDVSVVVVCGTGVNVRLRLPHVPSSVFCFLYFTRQKCWPCSHTPPFS
jgi:hypothetical protein